MTYNEETDITNTQVWMWIWYGASALATGVIFGNVFQSSTYRGETVFAWGPFLGGVVVGLIANIPLMALFDVGKKILATQRESLANGVATRKHTARIPLPPTER